MSGQVPWLEFEAVRWPGEAPLTLRVGRGDCVFLLATEEDDRRVRRLANAAVGIEAPLEGAVRFAGEDWSALSPAAAEHRRARIGRVFCGAAWVSNLDVDENVLLARLHHTHRRLREWRAEAERIAHALGLTALPSGRAAWTPPRELQRAQWVRALLGAPDLLILEHPERGAEPGDLAAFGKAADAARARGAGVLWITARDPGLAPVSSEAGALRTVEWNPDGSDAEIIGNGG